MGRLTLNVLLSFAQFERELIGERVRDKIAASKRKGIWVGGPVPLGYAAVDKKVVVVPAEAEAVRTIFERYLALGSIRGLADDLDRRGIRSKPRQLSDGRTIGGGANSCDVQRDGPAVLSLPQPAGRSVPVTGAEIGRPACDQIEYGCPPRWRRP